MATTTNLDTFKINYLTKAQYDAEVAGGRIDENALYLTPDSGAVTEVIDQGSSGGWTYRKWSDGTMEMWGTAVDSTAPNTSDAGGYRTTGVTPNSFPFSFSAIPVVNVNIYANSLVLTPICLTDPSTTSAGKWAGYRVSSNGATRDKRFMFYVVGSWQ